jgi:hypothetical protein
MLLILMNGIPDTLASTTGLCGYWQIPEQHKTRNCNPSDGPEAHTHTKPRCFINAYNLLVP